MTVALFFNEGGLLRGFQVSGHSEYGAEGTDIVCAAVTSAVRLAECILTDVRKLKTESTVDERLSAVRLTVAGDPAPAQDVLSGLRLYLKTLSGEYPEYLKVLEV